MNRKYTLLRSSDKGNDSRTQSNYNADVTTDDDFPSKRSLNNARHRQFKLVSN
jgi:hypothetical protein